MLSTYAALFFLTMIGLFGITIIAVAVTRIYREYTTRYEE